MHPYTEPMLSQVSGEQIIGGSAKPPSSDSEITNPAIDKATFTSGSEAGKAPMPESKQLQGSESEAILIGKMVNAPRPESEHTPDPEVKRGSESTDSLLKGPEEKKTNVPRIEKDLGVLEGTQEVDPNVIERQTDK